MIEIPRSAWKQQPWKNGRGITHEIWRVPQREGDFDWRMSLAEVTESGAFSTFPGYLRWTYLVGPAPISFGEIDLLAPGDHIETLGDTPLTAQLRAGPTALLNVLSRADHWFVCGYGASAHPVRFAFDLALRRALRFDPPARHDLAGHVWIS